MWRAARAAATGSGFPMANESERVTAAGTATLLDARGLTRPLPVLKARKRLMGLARGERLLVLATDPKAPDDFRAFCAEAGHALLETGEEGGAFRFLIGRG